MTRNCLSILLIIALAALDAEAQVSAGADGLFIKDGTQVSLDGLKVVPFF